MQQEYIPLSQQELAEIQPGDVIERMLAFSIPLYMNVTSVTNDIIEAGVCGWTFDRKTGLEIDEDISTTVSYIKRVLNEEQKHIIKNGGKL